MNIEKLQIKGQLAEAKQQFKDLDIEASSLIVHIRNNLNPFEEDITKLNTECALTAMKRLDSINTKLKVLKEKIKKLESYFE